MGSVSNLLEIARKEIGVRENPPDSNRVKYNTWFWGWEASGSDYPWCMVFCQWVYDRVRVALPSITASCGEMKRAAANAGMLFKKDFRPGDLALLSFNGSIAPQHCGIIEDVKTTTIITIEGNTGVGNDANGGMVMRRSRSNKQVVGVVRPIFDEEIDMTIDEFIKKLTPAQAYELMKKAEAHADKQPLPTWAKNEGYWKEMLDKKFVTSDTPEGHLKRDEFVSILGRMGLIDSAK